MRNITTLYNNKGKIKHWYILLFCVLFSLGNMFPMYATDKKDPKTADLFDIITTRIQDEFEGKINLPAAVARIPTHLSLYNAAEGSFSDVNYAATDRTNWPPLEHIERLYDMTYAYTMAGNIYYEDESILKVIEDGFEFWVTRNPNCSNWWYNEIGEPQRVGRILLQLRRGKAQLAKATEDKVIARMKSKGGNPASQAGPNKTDIALHWLYRSCLTKDQTLMVTTMGQAYVPLKYVTGEGLQFDNSYFQHGKQLYIGGYGDELLKGVLMFANYTVGTEYELKGKQLEILSNFARNTYFKVIRGNRIHMNVLGRGVSRKGATGKSSSYAESLEKRDPLHAAEYQTIIKRLKGEVPVSTGIKADNTNYYIGDYVIHTRPDYAFGVRTVSIRTLRNEYGNGEALQIYFMSDGATHITQQGGEYYDIFAVWDWAKIPGVTNPQYAFANIPKAVSDMTTWGTEKLVGGASDSLYSVNTYRLNDSYAGINTQAYKSWFFFDDEVVCLGSGIKSTNALEINTTVDQSLLTGDITVSTGSGESVITQGEYTYNDLKWVMHNDRGYVFPNGGNLVVKNALQEGNWNKINTTEANRPDQKDVFSVWFNHGIKPKDDKYAYIVVPNKKSAAEMNAYNASNIEILANTDSIQAVHHKGLGIWQLAFTRGATFEYKDMIIKTDNAATMILKNIGTPEVTMHISDPTQSQIAVIVATLLPSTSTEMKQTVADFYGEGNHAGKTKVYTINSSSDKYVPPIEVPVVEDNAVVLKDAVAIADSYIQGNVNTPKGAENRMIVKNDNTIGTRRMGFVRVPLNIIGELEKPEDYNLTISLDMYVFTTNTAAKTTNWTLTPTTSDWDETTVVWNNQPSVATAAIASIPGFDPEKENLENPQNIASFDITAYAFEQYKAGKTDIAFRIFNDKAGAQVDFQLASKEHENTKLHPKIVIRGIKKEPSEEIETPTRIIEYVPAGDAYVESKGQENNNYGKAKQLQVKNMLGGLADKLSYLNYDLTKLKLAKTETFGKIFLRLYLTSTEDDANKVYWTLHKVDNTEWSEDAITYKTKPIIGEVITMLVGKMKMYDTEDTVEEANYITFDLTDYILAELEKGTKSVSLALFNHARYKSSAHGSAFASKEHLVAEKHPVLQAYVYGGEGPPVADDGTAITELTINGQTWTTNQTFVVPKEYTDKKIAVNITVEAGATVSQGNSIEIDVTNPSMQKVEIEVVAADGVTKRTHVLKVEKRFLFDNLVFVQWNNTMSAKNTPLTHGYTFSAYQWYKNELPIYGATRQFYSVGYNGEAINPDDTYFVEVTDSATGNKLRCWESHVVLKSMDTKAYPNPVNSGESVNVNADIASELLKNAVIEIYNMNGFRVKTEPVAGQITTIIMPTAPGTYILKLVANDDYTKSLKVVVK